MTRAKAQPQLEIVVEESRPGSALPASVGEVAARLAPGAVLRVVTSSVTDPGARGAAGPCRVLVNGDDVAAADARPACAGWPADVSGEDGPPIWMVEAALLRALSPSGYLFLCVANSARSQMAEGIARALLPAGVRVWSAGSRPTRVRPEAVAVLEEIGIDISAHRSKAVSEIPAAEVDAVVTLCAGEECPVFLGAARRLHWGLADPAAAPGNEEERLASFRRVRDELGRRLSFLVPRVDHE